MTRRKRTTRAAPYLGATLALSVWSTMACDSEQTAELPETGAPEADAGFARDRDAQTILDAQTETSSDDPVAIPVRDASRDASDADRNDASVLLRDAGEKGPVGIAGELDEMFLDVACASDTPTPLAMGATCAHAAATQKVERGLPFGGEPGRTYRVRLRVRGIWEPTSIAGGTRPSKGLPVTVGGSVATGAGDPINYQQYSIRVSAPKQVYWLNDYRYVAHDIHKEDYEVELQIAAGAELTVSMNDGNDHQIGNWTKDLFMGLSPYAARPSTGQLLRLDVLAVDAL